MPQKGYVRFTIQFEVPEDTRHVVREYLKMALSDPDTGIGITEEDNTPNRAYTYLCPRKEMPH